MPRLKACAGSVLLRLPILAALLAAPLRADYPRDFRAALEGFRGNHFDAVEKAYLRDASGSGKDRLLALYELGTFAHLAGDYGKSIEWFNTADTVAHEYEGRAVLSAGAAARTAGALLLNDTVLKYEGQAYEKVMSRTLNAINYLMVGDPEGARVELRKAEEYQRLERERHQKEVEKAGAKDAGRTAAPAVQASYGPMFNYVKEVRNSCENAFTYYLASQVHLTQGPDGLNDAMVAIRKAYELAPQAPAVRAGYLEIATAQGGEALDRARTDLKVAGGAPAREPGATASVLVCYEAGLVPELEPVKINLFAAGQNYAVAFPIYRNFEAAQASVAVAPPPPARPVSTTPVVDTRTLAVKSLQERVPGILTRSMAGLLAKAEVQKQAKNQFGFLGGLVASVASAIVTEADLRSWLSLPAQVQVAKCDLPPGTATLTLTGPGWVEPVTVNADPSRATLLVVRAFPGFRRVDTVTVDGSLAPTPAQAGPAGSTSGGSEPAGSSLAASAPVAPEPAGSSLAVSAPVAPEPAGTSLPGTAPGVPEPAVASLPGSAPGVPKPAASDQAGSTPPMPGPSGSGLPGSAPPLPEPAGPASPGTMAGAPGPAEPAPPEPAPTAGQPAFSEALQAALGPREEGRAQVVFFRPGKMIGALMSFIVREQTKELGKLSNASYFVTSIEPGQHTFTVHSETTENTTLDLAAGTTYFISGSLKMGVFVARPHLARTDPAAFAEALPRLKPSNPH